MLNFSSFFIFWGYTQLLPTYIETVHGQNKKKNILRLVVCKYLYVLNIKTLKVFTNIIIIVLGHCLCKIEASKIIQIICEPSNKLKYKYKGFRPFCSLLHKCYRIFIVIICLILIIIIIK